MPMPDPVQTLFKTRFEIKGHVYNPLVGDGNEALASLDQLKGLLPPDIIPENDVDIIYIVGNLAVGGLLNQNDDGITIEDSLAVYKRFERRLCDIEHNRGNIVGYIVKAGLSEFGSNRLITEDEARTANQPFNIVTVAAVWRVANPDLSNFIMDSASPGHPDKDALSLSFEVGFNNYNIVLLPSDTTDLSKATNIIQSKSSGFQRYDNMLRVNKGSGKTKDGERVGRILKGSLVPLGQGIVTVPAASVKGIEVIDSVPSEETSNNTQSGDMSIKHQPLLVYITSTLMTSATNRVKIPAGLQDKAKNLFSTGPRNYPKANVTLSDGRVLKDVTVFSGEELELDKELNLEGVVITDMNPQMPPQIDDSPVIHPHIDETFPTKTPEARVADFKNEEIKKVLQNMPYTDAIIHHLEAAARSLRIIMSDSSVSSTSTSGVNQSQSSMKLEDLKQLEAKVKSATKLEDVTDAFANVALFAEEIMKASEQYAKAAEDAKKAKEDADKQADAVKADLAEAKKTLKEMKDAKDAADAAAKFQERMTTVASTFTLDDEVRAYVAEEIKACTDDVSFDKWFTKAKKVLKGYVKAGELDGPSASAPSIGDPHQNATTKNTGGVTSLPGKDNVDSQDTACMAANAAAIASAKANPTDKTNIDVIGNVLPNESLTDTYRRVFANNTSAGGVKVSDFAKK